MKDGERMGKSEAQKRAEEKYRKKNLDYITMRTKKSDRLRELTNLGGQLLKKSSNHYMIDAIKAQLARDGITLDMLDQPYTPPVPEPKQPKRYLVYLVTTWYEDSDDDISFGDLFEKYVSVFQTLNVAKTYIKKKYLAKAKPEDWHFNIYGRYIEAENKLKAQQKYAKMAKEADKYMEEVDENGDTVIIGMARALERYSKPDYVESVEYKDLKEGVL